MNALGRHILVEYYGCEGELLNDVMGIEEAMVNAAKAADATVINSTFHHFSPFGVSGVVVIQESHLAIHTWPEYGYAAVDIFTCGTEVDPWICYKYLEKAFRADHGSAMELLRGHKETIGEVNPFVKGGEETPVTFQHSRDVWFTERTENTAFSLRHKGKKLYRKVTPFQKVEIYDTFSYGKTLTLDGMVMTTEKDEFVYHEMLTHVGMQTHPHPKRVLIIGGGDGGAVREIVRYPELDEVVLCEIDDAVIEASKEHLPSIAASFDHPKLTLKIGDGIEYVRQSPDESFDVVIVDSTDPVGPGEGLFTEDFYRDVKRILKADGLMITQSESPTFVPELFGALYQCYKTVFGAASVFCYLAFIPTYPSGMWSFSYCKKGDYHPLEGFDATKSATFTQEHGLKYYNAGIHTAAFALPGFVQDLIQ